MVVVWWCGGVVVWSLPLPLLLSLSLSPLLSLPLKDYTMVDGRHAIFFLRFAFSQCESHLSLLQISNRSQSHRRHLHTLAVCVYQSAGTDPTDEADTSCDQQLREKARKMQEKSLLAAVRGRRGCQTHPLALPLPTGRGRIRSLSSGKVCLSDSV